MIASSLQTITFLTTLLNISCGSTVLNITPFGKLLKHKQEDIKARNITKGCKTQNQKRSNAWNMSVIETAVCSTLLPWTLYWFHFKRSFCFIFPIKVYISYVQTHSARRQLYALCIICVFIYQDKRTHY